MQFKSPISFVATCASADVSKTSRYAFASCHASRNSRFASSASFNFSGSPSVRIPGAPSFVSVYHRPKRALRRQANRLAASSPIPKPRNDHQPPPAAPPRKFCPRFSSPQLRAQISECTVHQSQDFIAPSACTPPMLSPRSNDGSRSSLSRTDTCAPHNAYEPLVERP